ncbi:hypothetical protein [Streptomyces fulvoviolaceus]|uniref:hypothetical protein n=1 Tax=Streptomyces fulvoviolaceus TaxID=285535 RepID=UPI0005B898C8|nr:hypothetical protein [Streptomyces fulvoviolaceus]
MRNRSWIAAALATAGVVLGAALYIDELETGHSEGGLLADPRASAAPTSAAPTNAAPTGDGQCVGTQPLDTLPGFPDAEGGTDDTPFYRTLAYIDLDARPRHAAVYTGLSVDEPHDTLKIWRIPSAEFDADVCGAAEKGVKIRLYDTDVTRTHLDGLADRISEDMNRWDGTFAMREVGVDERGFVHVGVDDPKKAEPLIEEEFGPRYIKVDHVEQAYAGVG